MGWNKHSQEIRTLALIPKEFGLK